MRVNIDKRGSGTTPKQASSKYPFTVELPDSATVDDLKNAVYKQAKALYPDRQRLTVGDKKTVLASGETLAKYSVNDGDTIFLKDLGPQIGWRTVFYIEYIGPIIFHYLIYNFSELVYGQAVEHSEVQR
ncbi:3-oxo-5a-steroid 4- dehydrogenase [Coemansia sp. RSA 2610]|nr:3-oxo-5a-steroid 4- dehydrogenase [Coemansia sp. RSA 2610]